MTWSKGNSNGAKQEYGGYQGWSYWRGAASPGYKGNKGRGKAPWQEKPDTRQGQQRKGAFPHYDALPKGERQTLVEVTSTSSAGGYVSELQRAVNVARKAEQRVKKLAGEKQDRVQQWRDYEAELKRCYSVEKQRFRNALQKLERDEVEALAEQTAARESLRRVAVGQTAEPEDTHMEVLDQDFEMLTRSAATDPVQEEDADAVIQRALEASRSMVPPKPAPTPGMTTPLRRTQCPALTPDHSYSAQLGAPTGRSTEALASTTSIASPSTMASSDPYQCSPAIPRTTLPRPLSKGKEAAGRVGLKDAVKPKQPVHPSSARSSPSLAEKLEAKRMQQMAVALEAEGPSEPDPGNAASPSRAATQKGRLNIPASVPALIFDDGDEDLDGQDVPGEPGHPALDAALLD